MRRHLMRLQWLRYRPAPARLPRVFAIVLTLLVSASASAATISGTVTAAGGAALPSMTVAIYGAAGTEVVRTNTDSLGRYSVTVPAGTYRILAFDPQGTWATSFFHEASSFETSLHLTLSSAGELTANFTLVRAGRITGLVQALATGEPLSGMTVAAYNEDGSRRGFAVSGAAGGYTLVLPPGTYRVAAYDEGAVYAVRFFREKTSFETADRVTVNAGATAGAIDFSLPRSARASGTIVERTTGIPLAGITVSAFDSLGRTLASTMTLGNGTFDFAVPPMPFRLTAFDSAGTYATNYYRDASSFDGSLLFEPAAAQHLSSLQFTMEKGGRVNGQVRTVTGAALAGMTVTAYNGDGSRRGMTLTDGAGRYSLLLPPGHFAAGVHDDTLQFAGEFYSEEVSIRKAHPISVTSQGTVSGIDFTAERAGRLSGTAYRASDGSPLSGIVVTAWNGAGQPVAAARSGADGTFILAVPAGTYHLVAHDPALQYATSFFGGAPAFPISQTIPVAAEQNVSNLLMPMRVAGLVTGRVTMRPAGLAVRGAAIHVYDASGNEIAVQDTDESGRFTIPLPPGSYKLAASDAAGRFVTLFYNEATTFASATTVRIEAARTSVADFDVEPNAGRRRRPARLP